MTATEFRQHLYQVLNEVADAGTRAVVTHRNRTFYVVPEAKPLLTDRLVRHDTLRVSPDQLVEGGPPLWEWNEEGNLDGLS